MSLEKGNIVHLLVRITYLQNTQKVHFSRLANYYGGKPNHYQLGPVKSKNMNERLDIK